ncbi:hypothetical protein JOE38_001569 [Clavibacter michiganensis]|uniref:hypothetical protein n=1 Tax=Clavibacter michiganensis TaxID=28447 RepID=UPI00195BE955|nr:hypothetical protein [Clavibacter michiganensis]MBM7411746.1 hypothetical protein [Clavibacter michiganensis]
MSDEGRGTHEPPEGARAASGFAWPMWVNIGWIALGAWHVLAPVNDASGWLGLFQIGVGAFGILASRRRARRLAEAEADALPLDEVTRIPADVDEERARLDEAAAAHAEMDARLRALAMQLERPGDPTADPDKPEPPHQPTGRGRGRGRKDRAREVWPDDDLPPVARW